MSSTTLALRGFRQMTADSLQGGAVDYAGAKYDCTIGTFEEHQILSPHGGFTAMMLGDIQIAVEDLPAGIQFKTGHDLTVTRNTGQVHQCQVYTISDKGFLLHLTVRDTNEGA